MQSFGYHGKKRLKYVIMTNNESLYLCEWIMYLPSEVASVGTFTNILYLTVSPTILLSLHHFLKCVIFSTEIANFVMDVMMKINVRANNCVTCMALFP